MARPPVDRDPRRSLLIGGLIAGVVLAVLAVLLLIGVVTVFSVRQDPKSLGPGGSGRSTAIDSLVDGARRT